MTYFELVDAVRAAYANADASEIKEHIAFQFNIEGEGEGAFYLEIADGKINIQPYEYYDRDVLFTTTAKTLLKIGTGKLDPVFAYTTRKLKAEGNIEKALLLKKITPKSSDAETLDEPKEAAETEEVCQTAEADTVCQAEAETAETVSAAETEVSKDAEDEASGAEADETEETDEDDAEDEAEIAEDSEDNTSDAPAKDEQIVSKKRQQNRKIKKKRR